MSCARVTLHLNALQYGQSFLHCLEAILLRPFNNSQNVKISFFILVLAVSK